MKSIFSLSLLFFIFFSSSCASIVSKSVYPLLVNTHPASANIVIKGSDGREIFAGNSPATVDLKAGDGFFKKAQYTLIVSAPGYNTQTLPINFSIDGWYFGNIFLGGFLGMLIVDPATGAMWQLDRDYMEVNLVPTLGATDGPELKILDINHIPAYWKAHLERVMP